MGKTALFKASRSWAADAVRDILAAAPDIVDARDPRGRTSLQLCAARPLRPHEAAAASLMTAKALLDDGADVDAVHELPDATERFPATALWYAVARGANRELVRFLLAIGANPDHCLWAAAWCGDVAIARLLLDAGSRTELRLDGETPLVYAARLGREPIVHELVRAGADRQARDRHGVSPLEHALAKRLSAATLAALAR